MTEGGTEFGRYTLVRKVGTGGMAEIWKARVDGIAGFEKVLAIKKVLPQLVEEQGGGFVDLFIEEAKLAAQLVHPNIVQVFDFGRIGKRDYYIAMEYVAGANLARVIHRLIEEGVSMPVHCALYVISEAARGLGYAHAKVDMAGRPLMIVHRDVSPQNVLLSFTGEVKVADFGIAKVASAISMTAAGTVRGKLAYMSPEQASAKPLDNRSDLFSLGILLWEMLAGRRLFSGPSMEVLRKVIEFPGLTGATREAVPKELHGLLESMLAPDPDQRFPDAASMEAALAMHLGGGASYEARAILAKIVKRLFADELALETGAIQVADPAMNQTVSTSTPSQPTLSPPASPDATVIVKAPSRLAKIPLAVERETQTAPSQGPDFPTVRVPPIDRRVVLGASAGAILAAVLAGFLVAGGISGPAATPTPIAVSSAPPTTSVPETPPAIQTPTAVASATLATPTIAPPTATPSARPTARPQSTAVAVKTAPPVVKRTGTILITARPWCDLYLDGKLQGRAQVPQQPFRVPAGPHVVRIANSAANFSREINVDVPADGQLTVQVDVKAGSMKVR